MFDGKTHYNKWQFSMAMFNYQLASLIFGEILPISILTWGLLEERSERKTWDTTLKGTLRHENMEH